jgi:hypothetical protein
MNKLKFILAAVLMISVVSCSEGTSDAEVPCLDSLAVDTTKTCCDTVVNNPILDTISIADPR